MNNPLAAEPLFHRTTDENATGVSGEAGELPRAGAPHAVQSTDLFKGEKTVAIKHNGAIYRLQATRLGKLILTK